MPVAQKPHRTVAPAEALLTLAEVKTHLRIDHAEEDDYLSGLVEAATAHLDGRAGILGRALVTQTWAQDWSGFPALDCIRLPLPDVQSATITYHDDDDTEQAFGGDQWHLTQDARSSLILLNRAASWPAAGGRPDAVTITMVAGFGAAGDVPRPIRTAALMLLASWYENREAVNVGNIVSVLPIAVDALLTPYRRVGF